MICPWLYGYELATHLPLTRPQVFHHMYKVFCAFMSIFIVVFDLKKLQGSEEDIKKAKYHLTFWLNSIGTNASSHAPLVLLVGTHKDEVIDSCPKK